MAFTDDEEEFLDKLYDHLADDDNPDAEYDSWFNEKVVGFFESFFESLNGGSGKGSNSPRRRPRSNDNKGGNDTRHRRRRASSGTGGSSGYGSRSWFGN